MSKRQPYGFQRRQKQDARRAKQEAKRQRKAARAQEGHSGPEMGEAPVIETPPEQWEWFSPSRGRTMILSAGSRPDSDPPDDWTLLTDQSADGSTGIEPADSDISGNVEPVDEGSPGT